MESIIVFWQRFNTALQLIMEEDLLGKVEHQFWRVEYQNRGAIHIHMVIWVEEESIPSHAITAELVRSENYALNPVALALRCVQLNLMHHACLAYRCTLFHANRLLKRCKYGYPAPRQDYSGVSPDGKRYSYVRRGVEDARNVATKP